MMRRSGLLFYIMEKLRKPPFFKFDCAQTKDTLIKKSLVLSKLFTCADEYDCTADRVAYILVNGHNRIRKTPARGLHALSGIKSLDLPYSINLN